MSDFYIYIQVGKNTCIYSPIEKNLLYTGKVLNKKRHGYGVEYKHHCVVYSGEWFNDLKDGIGTEFTLDGEMKFHGRFANGERVKGKIYHNTTVVYNGEILNNKYHGFGKLYSDVLYEGNFKNGLYHGSGTITDRTGIFEGEFFKDQKHGKYRFIDMKGNITTGFYNFGVEDLSKQVYQIWQKYVVNGDIVTIYYTHTDIVRYTGEVDENMLPHGSGIKYTRLSKEEYNGQWKHGMKHGKGKYFKNLYVGEFQDDKYHGFGKYMDTECTYIGWFKDDKMHGLGVYEYQNTRYVGDFEDGVKCGKGVLFYDNEVVYDGQWRDNECHGVGHWYINDMIIHGKFKDDICVQIYNCEDKHNDVSTSSKLELLSDSSDSFDEFGVEIEFNTLTGTVKRLST